MELSAIIALLVAIVILSAGLVLIIVVWVQDCKKYGKENLGTPLEDRIFAYVFLFIVPPIVAYLTELF